MSENTMTKSQAKRKARQEENKKAKKAALRGKITGNLIIIAIIALFAAAIGSFIYNKVTTTEASSDYGAYLNDDGTIKGITPTDYVEPFDYKAITVAAADIEYTQDDIDADINAVLSEHVISDTNPELAAVDGDTLNIDYVGTIDGEEFDGGSTGVCIHYTTFRTASQHFLSETS